VLEPYVSISHQRLLDGLIAGGFFLVRTTPYNQMLQGLIDSLAGCDLRQANDTTSAPAMLPPDRRQQLQQILDRCRDADATPDLFDPVTTMSDLQQSGFVPQQGPILPRLDEISFDSPQQLRQRIAQLLHDEPRRRDIRSEQRTAVEERFLYIAGIRRMIDFILNRIQHEDCTHDSHRSNDPADAVIHATAA
jgi:hypothetical protein